MGRPSLSEQDSWGRVVTDLVRTSLLSTVAGVGGLLVLGAGGSRRERKPGGMKAE